MGKGDLNLEITGDADQAMRELDRLMKRQQAVIGKLRATNRVAKQTGQATSKAFGGTALSNIQSYLKGVVGVAAGFGLATKALREFRQMEKEAATRITDVASGRRALLQVADDTPELQRLNAIVAVLREQQGLSDVEAYKLTFAAKSAGQLKNAALFAQLKQIGFDPEAGIESVQKIQAAFGGRAGAGSAREILNEVLAAAGPSPVMAPKIARAASTATAQFSAIGGTATELLAMLSIQSETFKTPEAAAQMIKSVSDQVKKKRHLIKTDEGLTGLELLRALKRYGTEGKLFDESGKRVDYKKFLGEGQAITAVDVLLERGQDITDRLSGIQEAGRLTGTDQGLLTKKFRMAGLDTHLSAVFEKQAAEQARQIAEEDRFAAATLLVDSIRSKLVSYDVKKGYGAFNIFRTKANFFASRVLAGTDERFLEELFRDSADVSGGITGGLQLDEFENAGQALGQPLIQRVRRFLSRDREAAAAAIARERIVQSELLHNPSGVVAPELFGPSRALMDGNAPLLGPITDAIAALPGAIEEGMTRAMERVNPGAGPPRQTPAEPDPSARP